MGLCCPPTVANIDGRSGINTGAHRFLWCITLVPSKVYRTNGYPAFQMNRADLVSAELFSCRNSEIVANLKSPSSSSIISSSSTSSELLELNHPEYATTPCTLPVLTSIEQSPSWRESFIMPTDSFTPAQVTQGPSTLLSREWIQQSTAHTPANFLSGGSSSFVMTCPLPLCSRQSSELISIWRHITWNHLGDRNKCSKAMAELVEKVVLGAEG